MLEVKARGINVPQYYNPLNGEYKECEYLGDKPKVISVWPGIKAVYIPPELNENPNVIVYADLNKWEATSNLEMFKQKVLEIEGRKRIDFADWICPYLGVCPGIGRCEFPVIKPETYTICPATGFLLENIFNELGISHRELYQVKEQVSKV